MNWKNNNKYKISLDEEEEETQVSPIQIMGSGMSIRVLENKIFFYEDITNESILELNRLLVEVDTKLQNTKNILGEGFDPIIHLRVKSNGGDLHAVLAAVDLIPTLRSKIYTYVDGCVASAGTMLTVIGKKRLMGKHAILLIHQLSGGMIGKYSEMEDSMENAANMMKFIKTFYKEYTKIPMKRLDELLKRDLFLNAEECLLYGFIDEIV